MRLLGRAWSGWKKVGQFLGDWMARVVLTLFYFSVLLPFGLVVRLLGDPLAIKPERKLGWVDRKRQEPELDMARRLF